MNNDMILEFLESQLDNPQVDISILISDYKKKTKRVDRIIKQSDKQQLQVVKLNEELDEYKTQLEFKVLEKTKELHELNLNLEQRVKEEVEANRIKDKRINDQAKFVQIGELMSNIAHHWRQPLNAISTSAGGMQMMRTLGVQDIDEENESIEQIIQSTQFLSGVIQDFANFVNDNQNSTSSHISLQENLNQSINIIASSLENNKITVIKNYPQDDIQLNIVSSKLSNSILNILKNAQDSILKTKEEHERTIQLTIEESNNSVTIAIQDSGIGINPDILSKIFDPYFTTKHQSQGTGLGLYTTKDDIEQHLNGTIDVINQDNGVEFLITLPK